MALAVDTPRDYELGEINSVPVKASICIYEGAAVGLVSGYARGLTAGDPFVGFAERKADNSATATDGYIRCRVIKKGKVKLSITAVAVTDVGKGVFASADGTFTLTPSTNTRIGNVHRYVTTDTCIVDFDTEGPVTAITAVATTGSTLSGVPGSVYGFTTSAQADAIVTAVNAILVALRAKGFVLTT